MGQLESQYDLTVNWTELFLRRLEQIAITYLTHRWVVVGIAAWLCFVIAPQLFFGAFSTKSPLGMTPLLNTIIGIPLLFGPMILVLQAKAQFAHSRSRLLPSFAMPHLAVLAGLLVALTIAFPLTIAACCRLDPLGITALAVAMAAPTIWAAHTNRMWGMLVGLVVFFSTMTQAGAGWWVLPSASAWPIHAVILAIGVTMQAGWFWRLAQLREEMDDYQTTAQWAGARKTGIEVAEQRRAIANQMRRSKLMSWVSDAWLRRLGGYYGGNQFGLARLLRYGFGQPAEVQGLFMAVFFYAFTIFMAKYSYSAQGLQSGPPFGAMLFYLIFATMFPGFTAGELLAQRRSRIATEMLRPLARGQLVDGLFAASLWNSAAMWLVMNTGLALLVWQLAYDQFTFASLGMLLLLTAAGSLAIGGVALRTAVWPSLFKRLAGLYIAMFPVTAPLIAWQVGRAKFDEWPFIVAATAFVAFGVWMITQAKRVWMNLELG